MAKTTAQILAELPADDADVLRKHIIEMDQGRRTIERLQGELASMEDFVYRIVARVSISARKQIKECEDWRHAVDTQQVHEAARGK